jgi:hypothetical protein
MSDDNKIQFVKKIQHSNNDMIGMLRLITIEVFLVFVSFAGKNEIVVYLATQLVLIYSSISMIGMKLKASDTYFKTFGSWFIYAVVVMLFNNTIGRESDWSTNSPHIQKLITFLIYVPSVIATFVGMRRYYTLMYSFMCILYLTTLIPFTDVIITDHPEKSAIRGVMSVIILGLYGIKVDVTNKLEETNAKRPLQESTKANVIFNCNVVCSIFYIFFGYFTVVTVLFLMHMIALITEIYIYNSKLNLKNIHSGNVGIIIPDGETNTFGTGNLGDLSLIKDMQKSLS